MGRLNVGVGYDIGQNGRRCLLTARLPLLEILPNQAGQFTRFEMATRLELTVQQLAVNLDLKPTAVAGDERDRLNLGFKCTQDLLRHTDGPGEVVSNCAVGDGDVEHVVLLVRCGVVTNKSITQAAPCWEGWRGVPLLTGSILFPSSYPRRRARHADWLCCGRMLQSGALALPRHRPRDGAFAR